MTTNFTKPDLPVILTRKDWDKKKGMIAKMAGPTGVGAECDKVLAAYKAVKWDRLDLPTRRTAVMQNWRDDSFTKANWDKLLKDAADEVTGNLAKLSVTLYKLRDTCQKAAADFKKSRTIPSSAAAHALQMAKTADTMGVALNKNSMGGTLKKMNDEFVVDVRARFIDPMWPGIRKYAQQHTNLMTELRRDGTPNKLNGDGRTGVRDMTTGLGNIARIGERGFGARNDDAKRLFTQLSGWANTQGGLVESDASQEQVLAEIDKIEPVFTEALKFVASAK